MNDWYQRMIDTLQLNGKGERTQQAYARAVRMLSQFYGNPPDVLTEQELQDYFLHRKNIDHWSPKTMRICYCGIRFFYVNVLVRDWHILSILRAAPLRNSHLHFHRRKSPFTTITLIVITPASITGFLNSGLKRLLKSSQSLLVTPLLIQAMTRCARGRSCLSRLSSRATRARVLPRQAEIAARLAA